MLFNDIFKIFHNRSNITGISGIIIKTIPIIFITVDNVDTNKFEITKMVENVLKVDIVIGKIKILADSVILTI